MATLSTITRPIRTKPRKKSILPDVMTYIGLVLSFIALALVITRLAAL